jgi:hypothetical protein
MDNSPRQGEKSELAVASELMMQGYGVSFPFGHNHQYDLIVDKDGALFKIQVKTAKQEQGNRYYIQADANHYNTKYVDLFSGYSEHEVATFFIPLDEASGKRQRVTYTDFDEMCSKHNQQRANHISDYLFSEAAQRV